MDNPNIILIVFDTLRLDGLGCYNGRVKTPNIDAFAKESLKFENAVSPSPWTVPSHASMFSGMYPSGHGIHASYDIKADKMPEITKGFAGPRIASMLSKRGYMCEGISSNALISNNTGFEEGFSHFIEVPKIYSIRKEADLLRSYVPEGRTLSPREAAAHLLSHGKFGSLARAYRAYRQLQKKAELSNFPEDKGGRYILEMLNNSSYELPLFLFINFMEMHDPYVPGESYPFLMNSNSFQVADLLGYKPIPDSMMESIRAAYYRQASVIDSNFRSLMDFLRASSIYDSSLIIVTSDHGQSLHEDGFYGHGIFLHDELIRVPLLIKPPLGARIEETTGGMQSLSSLFEFITDFLDGGRTADSLTSEAVFSESYGMQHSLSEMLPDAAEELEEKRSAIDVPRKAVYKNSYKITLNGSSGRIEEFTRQGKKLDTKDYREVVMDLLSEIDIFRGREKFMLPRMQA